jgi:hypothetical protein
MSTNRLHSFFRESILNPSQASPESSFVPCPMFAQLSKVHQAQVVEIYQLAAQVSREQLEEWQPRESVFSWN